MSVEDHTVSFSLEVNVAKAYEDIRRVQTILYRTLGLLSRAGLGEDVDAAIRKVQELIRVLNMLRLSLAAFQAARAAAGDPIAVAQFAITLATTVADLGTVIEDATRGT